MLFFGDPQTALGAGALARPRVWVHEAQQPEEAVKAVGQRR